MSGGGSGGSGTQQYNWNDTLQPLWQSALSQGQQIAQTPYNPYPYQRVADMSQNQTDATSLIRQMVAGGGTSTANAANTQAENTLNGDYLTGQQSDPYANASNPYSGYGPLFQQQLAGQLGDITNAYNNGTAADTTRMFNLSGAFGGSAHQNAMANNEAALGKTLNNTVANAYQNQFNQSAGLQENALNRGSTSYQDERNRQMGAITPGQNANNMFFQGAQQLMGAGDAQRSYQQDLLNQAYNNFQTQQQYPYTQLDYLTGLYGRAQGGVSPNVTTTTSGYQASPYSQLLGGGLLAYGATH